MSTVAGEGAAARDGAAAMGHAQAADGPDHGAEAALPMSASPADRVTPRVALALMAVSGFAGLGYQMVWTQQCALWLGFEAAAVLAVVTAFFGGLALGALLLGGRIERSAEPRRWYLACEAAIGLWGLALVVLMRPAGDAVQRWIGAEPTALWQWAVSFGASFVLLLPATAAMGATLPAIERLARGAGRRSIAGLYAANTAGAVLGVLLVTFWLVPGIGLASTAMVCAGLNALCVVGAWRGLPPSPRPSPAPRERGQEGTPEKRQEGMPEKRQEGMHEKRQEGTHEKRQEGTHEKRQEGAQEKRREDAREERRDEMRHLLRGREGAGRSPPQLAREASGLLPLPLAGEGGGEGLLFLPLALSGLLGIGYEVMVVRVLSQLNEDTVYTFALLLAVYLVGTSTGAALYQRWLSSRGGERASPPPANPSATHARAIRALDLRLPALLAIACLLGLLALWSAPSLKDGAFALVGPGFGAALGVETLLALAAFALPTLVMGAWFSHLATRALSRGIGFGHALAVNTLGAAAAAPLFGVVLAPWLGPKATLLVIAAGYLLLAASAGGAAAPGWRRPLVWAPAAVLGLLGLVGAPLAFVDVPPGARIVSYAEGATAAVSVVEDGQGVARLRINNRQQEGSSASLFVDGRQALLPVLLHPSPRRVLFLGLGTGATSSTAAQDPSLRVDAVELLPEVIAASPRFTSALGLDGATPRLVAADARRYVRAAPSTYDVIVSDNFHPARSGSGALYTREHFEAVRERLAPGGLFCQWLPLHQLDLDSLRSVVRAFLAAYPDGIAVLASNSLETPVVGLVGHRDPDHLTGTGLAQWHDRLLRAPARRDGRSLADFGLEDEFAVLGSVVAGPSALADFAREAPMNTDDRPVVAYLAPRLLYAPESTPKDRLFELLHRVSARPEEVLGARADRSPEDARRLQAYWRARDRFLEAGRTVRPVADPGEMLAQVGAPLLDAARTSADFRPAYDPLLRMALALAPRDPAAARRVLLALKEAQPARPEAAGALQSLGQ
jgi:spermidine synthase